MACFQSAKRCEVHLDLDRLRDTLLDVLALPLDDLAEALKQDAAFCSDKRKTITDWIYTSPSNGGFGCEGDLKPPSDVNTPQWAHRI